MPMPGNPKHPPLVPTLSPSITNVVPLGTHEIFSGTGVPPGQTVHYGQGQRSKYSNHTDRDREVSTATKQTGTEK